MIKTVVIGDIIGRTGRRCVHEFLGMLREKYCFDILIANGENAAGGFGITKKIYDQFVKNFDIDCITMGNHWADKRDILQFFDSAERMVLPANMANVSSIDAGWKVFTSKSGVEFAVINVMGKAFMKNVSWSPFEMLDKIFERVPERVKVRIVDIHAEASSEKQGVGHYLTGKVSLVFGTHCHVQTADERIFEKKTGFITDIGMTGAYDSVIGIETSAALRYLMKGEKKDFEPSKKDPWLCGIYAEIDAITGHCTALERICWKMADIKPEDLEKDKNS